MGAVGAAAIVAGAAIVVGAAIATTVVFGIIVMKPGVK